MLGQIIIKKAELEKIGSMWRVLEGHTFTVGTIPAGATCIEAAQNKETGDFVISYTTPDETPFTISIGVDDGTN